MEKRTLQKLTKNVYLDLTDDVVIAEHGDYTVICEMKGTPEDVALEIAHSLGRKMFLSAAHPKKKG